jgi:hypothetical protein
MENILRIAWDLKPQEDIFIIIIIIIELNYYLDVVVAYK